MRKRAGGWLQLSCDVVYENAWIKLTHEGVQRPNGSEGIYGVVHFKNRAVGVVPIDDDGNTWLVRQSRYTLDQFTWEIPEGGAPFDEDPLEAAKRELEEEVGLIADQWQLLLNVHTSNSVTDEEGLVYLAKSLHIGKQALEDTEDIAVKKLSLREAIDMVLLGEITDAMSICALLKVAALLQAGDPLIQY